MVGKVNLKVVISVAMLIWGHGAVASVSDQMQTISSWTAHLNYYYPSLDLSVATQASSPQDVSEILMDLKSLEDELQGDSQSAPNSLKSLACHHPTCGDNTRPGGGVK